jgi:hypothetical protein
MVHLGGQEDVPTAIELEITISTSPREDLRFITSETFSNSADASKQTQKENTHALVVTSMQLTLQRFLDRF